MAAAGREAMAALAARLMGDVTGAAPSPPKPKPAAPAQPAAASASQSSWGQNAFSDLAVSPAPKTIAPAPAPPTKPTIKQEQPAPSASWGQPPPPHQKTAHSTATSQANNDTTSSHSAATATPLDEGPKYTAEQLKAAREFMSSATPGGRKSRPGSRARVLSVAPSASASDRLSRTATLHPVNSTSRATTSVVADVSHWNAPLKSSSPAPPRPTTRRKDSVVDISAAAPPHRLAGQAALPKFDFTTAPSSPAPKKQEESAKPAAAAAPTNTTEKGSSWQMKDITNTLIDRKLDVPPHLRCSTAVKQEVASLTSPQAPKASPALPTAAVHSPAFFQSTENTQSSAASPAIPTSTIFTFQAPAAPQKTATSISAAPQPAKTEAAPAVNWLANGIAHHRTQKEESKKEQADAKYAVLLEELRNEVALVTKRVTGLEKENFELQQQVEIVLQTEERRKFLGTDSANAPFGVNVQDPSGNTVRVQGTLGLKVGDLIRRIRIKAGLQPGNTKDPRVAFEGTQLGHGMTLGEAGVTADKTVEFTFRS